LSGPSYWKLIATTAGVEWAAEAILTLLAADRGIVGGWPGTVSEARTRLDDVWQMLALRPDAGTREHLARHAYDAARSAWRSSAVSMA
jgi:hypothetical protein